MTQIAIPDSTLEMKPLFFLVQGTKEKKKELWTDHMVFWLLHSGDLREPIRTEPVVLCC